MNKKIIIGCVGAAFIIIFASFTNAIGVQNTKTTTNLKNSPLFNLRTQRVINTEENEAVDTDYIGKGIINIPLPTYKKIKDIQELLKQYNMGLNKEYLDLKNLTVGPIKDLLCILCILSGVGIIIIIIWIIIKGITFTMDSGDITCRPEHNCPSILTPDPCARNLDGINPLKQEILYNPIFQKLITDHPELLPEI